MYTYVHLCTPAIPDTPLNTLYTPLHDRYKDGSPKALCRRDKSVLSIALPAKTTEERLMRTTECLGVYIGTCRRLERIVIIGRRATRHRTHHRTHHRHTDTLTHRQTAMESSLIDVLQRFSQLTDADNAMKRKERDELFQVRVLCVVCCVLCAVCCVLCAVCCVLVCCVSLTCLSSSLLLAPPCSPLLLHYSRS